MSSEKMGFPAMLIAFLSTFHSGGALDLSSAFFNVPYDTFQVRVYKEPFHTHPYSTTGDSYYYAPACIFVPNSTYIVASADQKQNFVVFSINLWDDDYQSKIQLEALKKFSANNINLRMIPFHSFRLELIDSSLPIIVANNWIPIPHQPANVLARMPCWTERECDSIKNALESKQDQLLFGMEVVFKLDKPVKTKRAVTFETSSFQTSSLFSLIEQQFAEISNVCLGYLDIQRMVREVLENIMESSVPDEEFVPEDQLFLTIKRAIRMIKPNIAITGNFIKEDWSSVFWPADMDRPDEKVKGLNDLINNGGSWMKSYFPVGSNFAGLDAAKSLHNNESQVQWTILRKHLERLGELVEWNGTEFVIKPVTLYCVNLTTLRSNTVLGSINVWTSGRAGDLTSAINVPLSTVFEGDTRLFKKTNERLDRMESELRNQLPTGSVIAFYQNNSLPKCWLYCDGQSFDVAQYPVLAKVLYPQTATPDLRGRVLIGLGSNYTTQVGEIGGEATHQLTLDEMPPHQHRVRLLSDLYGEPSSSSGPTFLQGNNPERVRELVAATTETGSGKPHNNLPPFSTVTFIIRAC